MPTSREVAARLRRIADELDPEQPPDPEPVLVKVKLIRDGVVWEQRFIPVPCIGDGLWGALAHKGERVRDAAGTPLRDVTWSVVVERVNGEG